MPRLYFIGMICSSQYLIRHPPPPCRSVLTPQPYVPNWRHSTAYPHANKHADQSPPPPATRHAHKPDRGEGEGGGFRDLVELGDESVPAASRCPV